MSERLERVINNVIERDKIQLSEIKKKRFKDYTLEDYVFLHEQAERVEELEKDIENYKKACASWETVESYSRKEAQRYKQALEEIRSEASSYMWSSAAFRLYDIANEALEEESQ